MSLIHRDYPGQILKRKIITKGAPHCACIEKYLFFNEIARFGSSLFHFIRGTKFEVLRSCTQELDPLFKHWDSATTAFVQPRRAS